MISRKVYNILSVIIHRRTIQLPLLMCILTSHAVYCQQYSKTELADVKFTPLDGVDASKPAKITISSGGVPKINAALAVLATKRIGARILCVDVELSGGLGPGRIVSKMAKSPSCSNIAADGSVRIVAPQSPTSMVAIYLEIPEEAKLEFAVDSNRVFSGQIARSFAWRNGQVIDSRISGPSSAILLAQGFDLSPQTAKIVESKGIYFANSEALKSNLLTPDKFQYKTRAAGPETSPMIAVQISIDAQGGVSLAKPLSEHQELQPVIEQYLNGLKFKPFLAVDRTIQVRGVLNFRSKADGSVWGPVNLLSFDPIEIQKGASSTCCQK